MTNTLQDIAVLYKAVAPNVSLVYTFDSSGTLKTQIENYAYCDLFISAGQLQVDQLDIAANPSVNTGRLDFVLQGTRIDLLENQIALCVPSGNPAGIQSFNDMAARLRNPGPNFLFAMGNSDVPVGQYTQRIFSYYGLDERALASSITYGSNVREVTTQISAGSVSCGVVYQTDAFSTGLTVVDRATSEMLLGQRVIYPAAVMKNSRNVDAARAFLAYLRTPAAMAVFERVGFAPVR
jgi:molybdate transport system substrate-binding protein